MSKDSLSQLRAGKLAGAKRLDLTCGLEEFPREIFDLADSLEVLNLSGNRMTALPDDFSRLSRLRILFCADNRFREVPPVLGQCASLEMVGFKSCEIETVEDDAIPRMLRWLILTDNQISSLPASLGRCQALQKLMLSGNRLEQLPDEMAACMNLELVRLAANRLRSLPDWLLTLPRLSWLAVAGNPCFPAPAPATESHDDQPIDWADLHIEEKLGEGASGNIHKARWQPAGRTVAVKVFKGAVTSDGLPENEIAACIAAGAHASLPGILGRIVNHPEGKAGLVMSLIDREFQNLAGPPSFESCTRDVYADDFRVDLPVLLKLALGVASAVLQLHERGITHGDLYAHNVLWRETGDCLLSDFGAASFFSSDDGLALERIEVRAFGCLLEELATRCNAESGGLDALTSVVALQMRCLNPDVLARPRFAEIRRELERIAHGL
jgi:Protein tyrosine and serine/threonine kinase/Leucine rich repeat